MLFEHLALNSYLLTAVMIATGRGGWPLLLTFLLMSGTKLVVLDFQMPPSEPKTFKKDPPEKMGIHTGKIGMWFSLLFGTIYGRFFRRVPFSALGYIC